MRVLLNAPNPLRMNDWGIRRFLVAVIGLQLALWALLGLDALGLEVPVLRQLVGLVYVAFVPGILLLRVLRVHDLGGIETLLYSVGLSLAVVMFGGAIINALYPVFGVDRPISLVPVMLTLTVIVLGLCVAAYVRDRGFSSLPRVGFRRALSAPALFLYLLPLLSILGTQLVNFHQSNVLLLVLIVLIGLTVVLIGFRRFIPRDLYPLAVFAIALSLLFYRSLISQYISGFDIHEEYYTANLVSLTGQWDPGRDFILNNMLSVSMLAPIVSAVSGVDLTWVFKAVYPVLFSVAVLGLHQVSRRLTGARVAFLASFFFVAVYEFYTEIPVVLRQQVATLFLVALIMLMVARRPAGTARGVLAMVFAASLAVSHYGLSFIFVGYLVFAWAAPAIGGSARLRRLLGGLSARIRGSRPRRPEPSRDIRGRAVQVTFVAFFIVFALAWYMYTSGSSVFASYVLVGSRFTRDFAEYFLDPSASHGMSMLLARPEPGFLRWLNLIINYLNQVLIVIGVAVLLARRRTMRFGGALTAFCVFSLLLLFAGVLFPFITMSANMERLYHIALIFLAPVFIIGTRAVLGAVGGVLRRLWKGKGLARALPAANHAAISIYLVVFFLFQTGFVWQVTEGHSGSISLSQEWIRQNGSDELKASLYAATTSEQDVMGAVWLAQNGETGSDVYAARNDVQVHALTSYGMMPDAEVTPLTRATEVIPGGAYVYLQYLNVVEGLGTEFDPGLLHGQARLAFDWGDVAHLLDGKGRVYTNGGSEVHR